MNTKPTSFEDEARARISWGEAPERVLDYLKTTGWGEAEASAFVAQLQQERSAQVRCDGIVKMLWGVGLIALGFVVLDFSYSTTCLLGGGALCLGGGGKIVQGLVMLMAPRTEKGDLSDPWDEK
jgi:hypothetical protein